METFLVFSLTFLWSLIIVVCSLLLKFFKRSALMSGKKRNVMFVVSHPDDECMFFAPSILQLTTKHSVFLLCLSNGDYNSEGIVREKELLASCQLLNISRSRIRVLNDDLLQDHPLVQWRDTDVSQVLAKQISIWNIDTVITFDEYGVSGHSNHKAAYHGVRKHLQTTTTRARVVGLKLRSHNLLRKYSSVFDVVPSLLLPSKHVFISNLYQFNLSQRAMLRHRSQLEWFRYLYIACSRYMLLNDLEEIE